MKVFRGQKHPSEAKNGMKELIYWKKYLIKVSQKPLSGSNHILSYNLRIESYIFEATDLYYLLIYIRERIYFCGYFCKYLKGSKTSYFTFTKL
jgi:hypothetical protein